MVEEGERLVLLRPQRRRQDDDGGHPGRAAAGPTRGSIIFDGSDITKLSAAERVALGITLVPEGRQVFPDLSVSTTTSGSGPGCTATTPRSGRGAASGSCDYFPRLAERAEQMAGTLSGGEQQMLAIGRALMSRPRLLLIDEASLGLSPALTQTVFSVIDRINDEGVTVVLVEQNIGGARPTPTGR